MKKKLTISLAIAAVIGIGAYWYWSPYMALREMRSAAQQADPDTFNEHVDYPKLRESLKEQLSATLMPSDSSAERAGAALGGMIGMAFMDRMIDAIVRPETVMRAMRSGTFRLERKPQGDAEDNNTKADGPAWHTERSGANTLFIYAGSDDKPVKEQAGFVLVRHGFADWKLTEVRLPAVGK